MDLEFNAELIKGTLVKRYKRFLADITLENGEQVVAHCPNTGSMKTCGEPGDVVYLSFNDSPKRKLKYTWEFTQNQKGLIGVNTARPNGIVEEAIAMQLIPELAGYKRIRREVKYGTNSRIDLLLEELPTDKNALCWVEVKNATLLENNNVTFPDAKTARGLKHLNELIERVKLGDRAVMFYLVNRPDGDFFSIAKKIDPEYYQGVISALEQGVEVLVYRVHSTSQETKISEKLEFKH